MYIIIELLFNNVHRVSEIKLSPTVNWKLQCNVTYKNWRESTTTIVLMKIDDVYLFYCGISTDYECIRELECKSTVMSCQYFASESHRKATKKEKKRKERNVVLFLVWPRSRLAPVQLRHDGVSSRNIPAKIIYHVYEGMYQVCMHKGHQYCPRYVFDPQPTAPSKTIFILFYI